ncbi:hypothetical protein QG085_03945 [Kingella kingae]|uniref:hypothetical protein n=1 Tax=Kingella kingae TaxID=504 RepID=UPI0004016CB8|nr:hypothetical protein [Kingella kingae]MDK4544613.1 hypothetical protein [Kingella kingae]MDK4566609.1 hypothetical protein [Kingella kingae]MDK4589710.1 hypothetical protein [Kingella kingae]MDK4628351.1 hypothetical protein [Kingella kingae]MDK4636266.1 hypothetical protein [Kingella kingae]
MERVIGGELNARFHVAGCFAIELIGLWFGQHTSPWNERCPAPKTASNGMLAIKDGETLKCQIRVFTSNMGCSEKFTNAQGDDGLACTNSEGKGAIFFFDNNGVLKSHKFLSK